MTDTMSGLSRMESQYAKKRADAEWKRIQEKTFTRWCNQNLKSRGYKIDDLAKDLSDGVKLFHLLEVVSKKKLGKYKKDPTNKLHKLNNCGISIRFIREEGIRLVGIDQTNIVDGDLTGIMGLIWTLIHHYQISGLAPDDDDPKMTAKERLMKWIQSKLPDRSVKNFTTDWNSGVNIAALVDAVSPGLCPEWAKMDESPQSHFDNAKLAMDRAEEQLGVPQVLRPRDLINRRVDDRSVMTYLSYFPEAKLKGKVSRSSDSSDEPDTGPSDFKLFIDQRASVHVTKEYAESGKLIHAVLGSQACDLDSMVSAMAHAYFNEQVNRSFENPSTFHLPVFNMPRHDIRLRTAAVQLFKDCNVNTDSVTCIDDINLDELQEQGYLKLSLIDHNVLPPRQRHFVPDVVEILDHHEDHTEGVFDQSLPIWVDPEVGACATIIAECFLDRMPDSLERNPDLAQLLLGVILLKTVNLSPEAGRATERDGVAVEKLVEITGANRDALFRQLQSSAFNATQLSAYDLLKKDYRDATVSPAGGVFAGASSLPESLSAFVAREDAGDALETFTGENGLQVLVLVCIYLEGEETKRQLGLYCRDDGLRSSLGKYVEGQKNLELTPFGGEAALPFTAGYCQGNVQVSRRVILPIVTDGLEEISTRGATTDFKVFLDTRVSAAVAKEMAADQATDFSVVLGSQTCDVDSMVSAVAYAYFVEQTKSPTSLPFPIFNTSRKALTLRKDAIKAFADCNLDVGSVPCIDDVDLDDRFQKGGLELTLMAHNVPAASQSSFIRPHTVVRITDHHQDETSDLFPKEIKQMGRVGSTSTLVAKMFLTDSPGCLRENPDLVKLLLSTILLETADLSPEAGRATDEDREVVAQLKILDVSEPPAFSPLQAARFDVAGLSAYDILRKDYKDAAAPKVSDVRGGASSIPESLSDFLRRPDANEALKRFARDRGVSVLVLSCVFFDGTDGTIPKRQLGVYSTDDGDREKVFQYLMGESSAELTPFDPSGHPSVSAADQSATVSRAEVLPLLAKALDEPISEEIHPWVKIAEPVEAGVELPWFEEEVNENFESFLSERGSLDVARQASKGGKQTIHVVMGSQTGDIDSMVSAMAKAYLIENTNRATGTDEADVIIPYFNIPRGDLPHHPKSAEILHECNVATRFITCANDVNLHQLHSQERLKLTLVDHSVPCKSQIDLASDVVEIVDRHHPDCTEEVYSADVKRTIEVVGATSTLVAEDFLDQFPDVLKENPDLVQLLLSAILVGTENLNPKVAQVKDCEVFGKLSRIVPIDLDDLCQRLFGSKSALSAYDMLQSGYQFAAESPKGINGGVSTIPESVAEFLQRSDVTEALETFTKEENLTVLLLVGVSEDEADAEKKSLCQIGVYCRDPGIRTKAGKYLKEREELALSDHDVDTDNNGQDAAIFDQADAPGAREATMPVFVEFFEGLGIEEDTGSVMISGKEYPVDMKLIEPYTDVIQHAGFKEPKGRAVMVIAACLLPDKSVSDWEKIMENLHYYVASVLDSQASNGYMIVYLHGGTADRNVPKFQWMRTCYPMLSRRTKKGLKRMILVHCDMLTKAIIQITKPFVSGKFYEKLQFVNTLEELDVFVDIQQIRFPQAVLEEDIERGGKPILEERETNGNGAGDEAKIVVLQ